MTRFQYTYFSFIRVCATEERLYENQMERKDVDVVFFSFSDYAKVDSFC